MKFQNQFCNSILLPHLGLKQKSFEYQTCSKFRDLKLSCWANFHLNFGLKGNLNIENSDLNDLSFHVNFITFTPSVQLDFCLTRHGECTYKLLWTHLIWFESYFNFLTTRNWTPVYLLCLHFEFAKKSFKLNYVSQKYECVFILHCYDKVSMKVLLILKEKVLYLHILVYKDALLVCINLCYYVLQECLTLCFNFDFVS